MSRRHEHLNRCSEAGCMVTHPASHWDNIKAQELGWFFQKDGRRWCPKHVPTWVAEWRAKGKE